VFVWQVGGDLARDDAVYVLFMILEMCRWIGLVVRSSSGWDGGVPAGLFGIHACPREMKLDPVLFTETGYLRKEKEKVARLGWGKGKKEERCEEGKERRLSFASLA